MEIFGIYAQFYGGNVSILFVFILRQGILTKKKIMSFQFKGQEMNQLKDSSVTQGSNKSYGTQIISVLFLKYLQNGKTGYL